MGLLAMLCLLLSGDVHQCPGPGSNGEEAVEAKCNYPVSQVCSPYADRHARLDLPMPNSDVHVCLGMNASLGASEGREDADIHSSARPGTQLAGGGESTRLASAGKSTSTLGKSTSKKRLKDVKSEDGNA